MEERRRKGITKNQRKWSSPLHERAAFLLYWPRLWRSSLSVRLMEYIFSVLGLRFTLFLHRCIPRHWNVTHMWEMSNKREGNSYALARYVDVLLWTPLVRICMLFEARARFYAHTHTRTKIYINCVNYRFNYLLSTRSYLSQARTINLNIPPSTHS